MNQKYLVLVDFQNDFVHPNGALSIKNPHLIQRVQKFLSSLQKGMFDKIIMTADNHFADTYPHTPEAKNYLPHCLHGTWGWNVAVSPKRNIPVEVLYKGSTNVWNETANYACLQEDWKGREVYLAGVLSDVCVKEAMDGFLQRGARVTLIEDLCQGAVKQVSDIVNSSQYAGALKSGSLRQITAAQFFRSELLGKKIKAQYVYKSGEIEL